MARAPVVLLAPGVWRLPYLGDWINGFLLRGDDGQVTLVDCGLKNSPRKVAPALHAIGSSAADVTRILLTHAHPDHAGGAAEVAARTGQTVSVHTADAESLRRGVTPERDQSTALGRLFQRLPGGGSAPVAVGEELSDGQVLDANGELEVVHTPGHSPGHVSLLHRSSGVLITGDSIFNTLGMRPSPRFLCTDFRLAEKTAHRLGELDYHVAAFTHGPEIRDGARESIRRYLRRHGS